MAEHLEIGAVTFPVVGAWRIADIYLLWRGPDHRGSTVTIPLLDGQVSFPNRADLTVVQLPLTVEGICDFEGAPYANPREGLQANLEYLEENVFAPVDTGDGTRAALVEMPNGEDRVADVLVAPFDYAPAGGFRVQGPLELAIPLGAFALVGS
jgi:hypothetical protein